MDAVRDHIREFVKVERALVGDDGALGAHRKPLRPHVLVGRAGVATQPVQTAANVLVSPGANVVGEQLWTEASFAGLPRSEVAILAVGDLVQGDGVWSLDIRHK